MKASTTGNFVPLAEAMPLSRRTPSLAQILLAFATIGLCLALAHSQRIADSWHKTDGEDWDFFSYDKNNISSLGDCFMKRGFFPGLYRPLSTNLYYHLGGKLFGHRSEAYHAINLALLVLNGFLLYYLATLFFPPYIALVPPAFFVSRISHLEVVVNICECQSLLATFFSLLALNLFFWGRSRERFGLELAALPCLVLAFLSKESSFAVPAILMVFGMLFDRLRFWGHYLLPLALTAAWAALFVLVLRDLNEGMATGFKYNFSSAHILKNLTAYMLSFSNLLVSPLDNYRMVTCIVALKERLPLLVCVSATLVALGGFLVAQLYFWRGRLRSLRVAAFGLTIFVVGILPFVFFDGRLFMRYGYFSHLGLALVLGACAHAVIKTLIARSRIYFSGA